MREKLIELINEFFGCDAAYYDVNPFDLATYLLEKGVIVPPCKVGDIVWISSVNSNKVYSKTVKEILIHEKDGEIGKYIYCSSAYFPFENIGKTIFLTREEAENALKERVSK